MSVTRSIHFTPLAEQRESPAKRPRKLDGANRQILFDKPAERQNVQNSAHHIPSILIVGEIGRDSNTFGEQLRTLHHDPSEYHGKLQVMLSAARRIEASVKKLIEEIEERG